MGWQLGNISSAAGFTCNGLSYSAPSSPTTGGSLTLQVSNSYLRHMACYIQFSDETDTPITLDDAYLTANGMSGVGLDSAFALFDGGTDGTQIYRWLSSIGPVSTCCGVPLPVEPQTITIPLPLNGGVTTINLNFGTAGLSGTGNASTTMAGEILTLLFEMLMPGVLLLVGQAMSDSSIVQQLTSSSEFPALLALLAPFMGLIAYAWESYDWESFVSTLGSTCVKLLLKLLAKVGMSVGAGAGAVLGFAAEWASVAIVGVEVGETTYEIAISPPNYVVSMTMSCDVVVTINPDPDYNIFPAEASSYMVYLTYTTQGSSVTTVLATEQGFLPPTTDSTPVVCTFTDIPAGGAVIPSVVFCASNGWIAGQGVGAAIDTWQADSNNSFTVDGSITITTNPLPLNSDTKYTQKEMLVYDAATSAHAWEATSTPPATPIATVNNPITAWTGITLSQAAEMVSYGWQSESFDLPLNTPQSPPSDVRSYLVQTLSVAGTPDESLAIPGVSYTASTSAASILAVPQGTAAANFFLDPSGGPYSSGNPASGCHLRNYVANFQEAPDLAGALAESWGRFMTPIDRIIQMANFTGATLAGVSFTNSDLSFSNFTQAVLGSPSSVSADLSYTNLFECSFDQAVLDSCNLSFTALWGAAASITESSMIGANFSNAFLYQMNFSTVSDLAGGNFTGALLVATSFEGIHFNASGGANVSFAGAALQGASFVNCTLSNVDLTNSAIVMTLPEDASVNIVSESTGLPPTAIYTQATQLTSEQTGSTTICDFGGQGPCLGSTLYTPREPLQCPATQWPVSQSALSGWRARKAS